MLKKLIQKLNNQKKVDVMLLEIVNLMAIIQVVIVLGLNEEIIKPYKTNGELIRIRGKIKR